MQLSTKGRYGVISMLALSDLIKDQDVVPLSLIAEKEKISVQYLEQLFVKLRKADLVVGVRGQNGGYKLSRNSSNIYLSEIILAVEENLSLTRCNYDDHHGCTVSGQRCKTHRLWEALTRHVVDFFQKISLEDLQTDRLVERLISPRRIEQVLNEG